MLGLAQPSRWTCPRCQQTVAPNASSDALLHAAIVRAQEEHGRRHAAERYTAGAR